ncbi:MAG TPA: 2,4-diaminopentanoate dehydrogenase [Ignavibacteriales bacterium]|nr:2,4-diaminopentanoate dehydrogenase [Ignavibacteriales bacterium]HOL80374.1 2,4-diaminopentanoate dehydrogenase [Ignavibacteriales bacterium]HOM64825.1 2,4-diaminopentanoate dehydrogenase [Ignavibacteriales bacterium]HPD67442.1 2,4-diaminopentanoate dehydrogenase [Ignavibacteriales bacterium]HPP32563.1 2,4-diaminopentanoate dehydrogenase [Ignavibacteriales bacterium]
MENIKVVIWGFGAMGSGMAKMLLKKKGVEIVGVCDLHTERVGKSIFELLGVERGNHPDVVVKDKIEEVLTEKCCDVCLCATDSFVKKAFDKLKFALERKVNVISTAEEMAYPKAQNPELAAELDRIAKENGVTILGTGINPGLIMDLLVVCLTGCMIDVEHIEAKRVNSLSPFGPAVMEEQGVGLTLSEFNEGVANKKIAGHVGFAESITMIADALGLKLDKIETQMAPIVTSVERRSKYGYAAPGNVAGVNMTGQGYVDGKVMIDMIHPQQIEPELVGVQTGDYITIKGTPEVNMSIKPEVEGGLGTIAMCVNMIPHVINAEPGLKTMIDLPVPRAILGDMRDLIKK